MPANATPNFRRIAFPLAKVARIKGIQAASVEVQTDRLSRLVNPNIYASAEFAARRAQPDSFVNRVLAQPYDVVAGQLP